jgi:colanic acid/amylovoran biosynthesis protein
MAAQTGTTASAFGQCALARDGAPATGSAASDVGVESAGGPRSRLRSALAAGRDLGLAAAARLRRLAAPGEGVLLVPPAPPGSLGDEAMVVAAHQALAARLGEDLVTIVDGAGESWRTVDRGYRTVRIGELLPAAGRQVFAPSRRMTAFSRLFVLGADVLDGSYGAHAAPFKTLQALRLAALAGLDCRVLGFSYSSRAEPRAVEKLRALPGSVRLLARDPRSASRLARAVGERAAQVADVAFLLTPAEANDRLSSILSWIAGEKARGRVVVAVNLNAFFVSEFGSAAAMVATYARAIEEASRVAGPLSVVAIGHDRRGAVSDMSLARRLCEQPAVREHGLCLPEDVSAREVRTVSGAADVALSGRMHVTVGSLERGTPAGSITYQEKFEGLYELWGLTGVWIDARSATEAGPLAALLTDLVQRRDEIASLLTARRGEVLRLAWRNFEGVGHGRDEGNAT